VPDQMHLAGAALALGGRKTRPLRPDARPRLELPLHCGERGDGIWTIGPRLDGDDFHPEDRRILATLAREAEIALCNVLLLEALREQLDEIRGSRATLVRLQRQLLRTREAERGRLARDLHDGPIQTLVGMNLQLGLLAPAVSGAGEGPPAGEKLLELRASVRVLLAELRQVCKTLRPPMLDTLGLGAALRALVEDWAEQRGVAVRLNLAPDADLRRLPEEVAVNLYRVVQEALSNVARHAQARRVDLHLTADPASGCLELAIQDDGCGFIPATLAELTDRGHFGLAGIRERVDLIGGHWLLDSAPGRGTTLRVIWTPPPGPSGTAVPVLFPES
ncbi:MAG TPA: sensor histidine kinase, partial [Anaerolineae bacterium]